MNTMTSCGASHVGTTTRQNKFREFKRCFNSLIVPRGLGSLVESGMVSSGLSVPVTLSTTASAVGATTHYS